MWHVNHNLLKYTTRKSIFHIEVFTSVDVITDVKGNAVAVLKLWWTFWDFSHRLGLGPMGKVIYYIGFYITRCKRSRRWQFWNFSEVPFHIGWDYARCEKSLTQQNPNTHKSQFTKTPTRTSLSPPQATQSLAAALVVARRRSTRDWPPLLLVALDSPPLLLRGFCRLRKKMET